MKYYLQELWNDDRVTIRMAHDNLSKPPLVKAFLLEQFSFSVQANWGATFEDLGSINDSGLKSMLATAAQRSAGSLTNTQLLAKTFGGTIVDYKGTNKPTFTFQLLFLDIGIRSTNNIVMDSITSLLLGVVPSETETFEIMGAPLGYKVTGFSKTEVHNTWTVKVGNMATIPDLLLVSVDPSISRTYVAGTNTPLYARCNVVFEPAYMPNREDVMNWFDYTMHETSTAEQRTKK